MLKNLSNTIMRVIMTSLVLMLTLNLMACAGKTGGDNGSNPK